MATSGTMKEAATTDGGKMIDYFNAKGLWHRIGGPARIRYYADGVVEREAFWVNGELHREDGPARIWYEDGVVDDVEFWIGHFKLSPEEFLYKTYIDKLVDPVSREQAAQLAEANGWRVSAGQLDKAIGLTLEGASVVKKRIARWVRNQGLVES